MICGPAVGRRLHLRDCCYYRGFYSVCSLRLLMEQMPYNLLFRWFVRLAIGDAMWTYLVCSTNRDPLLEHDVVETFFTEIMGLANKQRLLSKERFSVDGILIPTRASRTNFRSKDYSDNPHANGTLDPDTDGKGKTLGAHKGHDLRDLALDCRACKVRPHVACSDTPEGNSAMDGHTSRHTGDGLSLVIRKRIGDHCYWSKTVGWIRHTVYRGVKRINQHFKLTTLASNRIRIVRTLTEIPQGAMQ